MVQGQSKTLSENQQKQKRARGVAEVEEHLASTRPQVQTAVLPKQREGGRAAGRKES
jgi:hypothetical protein